MRAFFVACDFSADADGLIAGKPAPTGFGSFTDYVYDSVTV
ncbi:hypothetical protein PMI23_02403, partial [Pseudomonas sp. GM24]